MTASPIKLRSGEWGVRTQGVPSAGAVVTVRAASGKTWTSTIVAVVWRGDGVAICAVGQRAIAQRSAGVSRAASCRECHGRIVDAPHHRAMGGLCGACAFDEYDC
jgi:cytochrome c553